jgi:hypothetical protein
MFSSWIVNDSAFGRMRERESIRDPTRSVSASAASDSNGFAGDPEGCIGCEEDGHGSDVLGFTQTPERGNGHVTLYAFPTKKGRRFGAFAARVAWCDCIDPNIARSRLRTRTAKLPPEG